jgi:hypothetical protein
MIAMSRVSEAHPKVLSAVDLRTNLDVIVKQWARVEIGAADLESIWRNEIRLLQALSAYPGGREYLLPLIDSAQDDKHFLLALSTRNRRPINVSRVRPQNEDQSQLLWHNVRRLVKAVGILHAHGIVHRNICSDSVFTALTDLPDFQLSGFEWSIRLREDCILGWPNNSVPHLAGDAQHFSFKSDWQSLGQLIEELFGAVSVPKPESGAGTNARRLTPQETAFINGLRFDGAIDVNAVLKQIDKIVQGQSASVQKKTKRRLFLIFDEVKDQGLWSHLQSRSIGNRQRNVADIMGDLRHCDLLEVKQAAPQKNRLVLRGIEHSYYLKEYGADGWDFPHIDRIERERPPSRFISRRQRLAKGSVFVRAPFPTEHEKRGSSTEAISWPSLLIQESEGLYPNPKSREIFDSFVLLHLLELLYDAAHIWFIDITHVKNQGSGRYEMSSKVSSEDDLTKLSTALDLDEPAKRLVELFERDQGKSCWKATLSGWAMGKAETDQWRYISHKGEGTERLTCVFQGSRKFVTGQRLRLERADGDGNEQLMRRRSLLLDALKEHSELTEMLADPPESARSSHDLPPVVSDRLDASKMTALSKMFATLPLHVLQGPPGTGKSHLVNELIRQKLAVDSNTRLLITSQGHEAVDHLMRAVVKDVASWGNARPPLIVRSRGSDDNKLAAQAKDQAIEILDNLRGSKLFQGANEGIQKQIEELRQRVASSEKPRIADKPLESLVLRSANILFATTNSADLKFLVDSLSRFDWSVIEEAGRATGNELLAPLMLSHRRLLIGDSRQLPPYDEARILRLLAKPSQLQSAVKYGKPLIRPHLAGIDVEYLFERNANPLNTARLADNVTKIFRLFESLHLQSVQGANGRHIASALDEQYRMHPALADVVSRIFYEGKLKTASQMHGLRAPGMQPYFYVRHQAELDAPIVMASTPYSQRVEGKGFKEATPAYHNQNEVEAVVAILSSLRAKDIGGKAPSLVVLTPYNEQVTRLRRRIESELTGRLAHLREFEFRGPIVQTIDSFQGDEADVVVASLVRNNARPWFKGLGILGDSRRMNVLLSRARWTIIIVGSLEFLRKRFVPTQQVPAETGLRFLKKLVNLLSDPRAGACKGNWPINVFPTHILRKTKPQK